MLINGIKFACNTCVKGHRSSNCNHIERPLFEIRKKGRPVTQCSFCRDLRKTRQIHIKCSCTDKIKNIENTATLQQQQKQPCYQCPSAKSLFSEDQNGTSTIAYSDLIQIDSQQQDPVMLTSTSSSSSSAPPSQCTCHETATKILYTKENWNSSPPASTTSSLKHQQPSGDNTTTPILPVRSRGVVLEENAPGLYSFQKSHSSSSLRFLGGQTKSPRRRSSLSRRPSTNSGSNSRRSTISHPSGVNVAAANTTTMSFQMNQQDDMMINMQPFMLTDQFNQQQQQITEMESESAVAVNSLTTANGYNVSSASSTSSSNQSSHSPHSVDVDMVGKTNRKFPNQQPSDDLGGFMMTDPDELTTLLNNVLMNAAGNSGSDATNNSNSNENINCTRLSAGTDMTRSTTTSSSTSQSQQPPPSCSSSSLQPLGSMLCGSFTPHSTCSSSASPIMEQQGESVVITITPLSNLLSNQEQRVVVAKEKPTVTRIVTCYYGNSCICPGCFVHPNNYQALYSSNSDVSPPYMQQPQQQINMQYQMPSNNSSLYSSDDEDLSSINNNNNYQAAIPTTF